ncbi:MAG: monovalent cation/H(+) antiporter subunit G, partial [Dehalococcoidia bacterium]|nr:monovalent cation/H(+) antiporter subunit G [Dehalococcoidia bacterium]
MTEFLSTVLLIIGASFLLLAAFGLLRMPDLFMRMSSASKGTTLGVGCMLLAVGVHFPGFGITTRAIAGILFFFTTTPVAAHM